MSNAERLTAGIGQKVSRIQRNVKGISEVTFNCSENVKKGSAAVPGDLYRASPH
jgi:hypothetical protein